MEFRKDQPGLDLGGEWQFAFSDRCPANPIQDGETLRQAGMPIYSATAPGNFELDLLANGLIVEPFYGMNIAELPRYERCHIWNKRRFESERAAITIWPGIRRLHWRSIGPGFNPLLPDRF